MNDIDHAIQILRRGGLVSFPTETVYGLGADATSASAVRKIFQAKGRPPTNPLIVHVADAEAARRYAKTWPTTAEKLTARLWPGPIALIVNKTPQIVDDATAGRPTVALRAPDHPLAQSLLRKFDGPIAAPSANRSTRISPTTADHVRRQLADKVDLILDGGPCRVGIESTVLDLTTSIPRILRPGSIDRQTIESIIGPVEMTQKIAHESEPAASPGQQAVHYAPKTPSFRFDRRHAPSVAQHWRNSTRPFVAILPSDSPISAAAKNLLQLPADPEPYARRLYAALHEADAQNADSIWIELPPDTPAWHAVRDRIFRATREYAEPF
ncbi:MAG: L-threonylcarbamoyladenylate synthase [Tepidisphaeraceae bacterium]